MEAKNFTVNISVNGEMDVDKIAQAIRKAINKVGPKPEPLKVGDYVVPLPSADDEYSITDTDVILAKVIDGCLEEDDDIRIEIIEHKDTFHNGENFSVNSEHFRKATEEEIAQANAEAERKQVEAKWAKIGRKVNEYKEGDIVRITHSCGAQPSGEIGEVGEFMSNDFFRVITETRKTTGNWQGADCVELITPVEARFDR